MTQDRSAGLPTPYARWLYLPRTPDTEPLSPEETATFENARATLIETRDKALQQIGHADGPFLVLNAEGVRPPLFWCFNNWAEAILLARKLGPDQPLYALHSLNRTTRSRRMKVRLQEPLARRYAEAIVRVGGSERPVTIGGNCQAAPIAEATAHAVMRAGAPPPLLITLEFIPRRAYPGPLHMMFGDQSRPFNPFLSEVDPVDCWRRQHVQFDWSQIPGGHGQYFREPSISALADRIDAARTWAGEAYTQP